MGKLLVWFFGTYWYYNLGIKCGLWTIGDILNFQIREEHEKLEKLEMLPPPTEENYSLSSFPSSSRYARDRSPISPLPEDLVRIFKKYSIYGYKPDEVIDPKKSFSNVDVISESAVFTLFSGKVTPSSQHSYDPLASKDTTLE